MSKEYIEALNVIKNIKMSHVETEEDEDFDGNWVYDTVEVDDGLIKDKYPKQIKILKQALQRLDKYEQILGNGRLTNRNYKNTTLDLDSCKPYVRLGQLEDIYEESKKNK